MKILMILMVLLGSLSCSREKFETTTIRGTVRNFVTRKVMEDVKLNLYKRSLYSSNIETVETIYTNSEGKFTIEIEQSNKYEYFIFLTDWRYFQQGDICPGLIPIYTISRGKFFQTTELKTASRSHLIINVIEMSGSIHQDSLYINCYTSNNVPYYISYLCFISDTNSYSNQFVRHLAEGNQYAVFNWIKNGTDSIFIKNYSLLPNDTTFLNVEVY